ncbi:unnamed protein product [Gadus morhua 'NCC']
MMMLLPLAAVHISSSDPSLARRTAGFFISPSRELTADTVPGWRNTHIASFLSLSSSHTGLNNGVAFKRACLSDEQRRKWDL